MFWCGDRIIDQTAEDDAVLFDQPIIEKKDEKTYEIFACNWQSIEIFIDIQTQWRIDQGVIFGLDYNAIKLLIGKLGVNQNWQLYAEFIKNHPELFYNQEIKRNEGYTNSLKKDKLN